MAIQQSINQLLSSAAWATGLYSHMPDVVEARKAKKFMQGTLFPAMSAIGKSTNYEEKELGDMTDEQLQKQATAYQDTSKAFETLSQISPSSAYAYRGASRTMDQGYQETIAELERRKQEAERKANFQKLVFEEGPQETSPKKEIIRTDI